MAYNTAMIRRLLLDAFSDEDLMVFCADNFASVQDRFGEGMSKSAKVDKLIDYAHRQELLEKLLDGVRQANPNKYQTFEPHLRQTETEPAVPSPAEPVETHSVRTGFAALSDLMRVPAVRDEAIAFRTDFQAACEQIDILGDYKTLHDGLHRLHFQCYVPLDLEVARFPDDQGVLERIMDYEITLQDNIGSLQKVANKTSIPANETTWIQDLVLSGSQLHGAIDKLDRDELKRAIHRLSRVLTFQPGRINARLIAAAGALRLPKLVIAVTRVCESLAQLELDPEKVSEFETGVTSLTRLSNDLAKLVQEHGIWQSVDVDLRRIEGAIGHDMLELEMSWPDLKVLAEPLYIHYVEDWAIAFKAEAERLDNAMTGKNPARINTYFRLYRRRAGQRFFQVDSDLKRLCDALRTFNEPLVSVMRMME